MTWNYRVLRYRDRSMALHKVYYDDRGLPAAVAAEPASFVADAQSGPEGIISGLEFALIGARSPALDSSEISGAEF